MAVVSFFVSWSLPSNGSIHHTAPYLRLSVPSSLKAYCHFYFSEGCASLPSPWLGFHCDYPLTAPTAHSLRPLVLSGSMIRCQSVQVYRHHPSPVGACKSSESGQRSYIYVSSAVVSSLFFCFSGADPSTMSSHPFSAVYRRPDYLLCTYQLYGLPEDPAGCPLLPQT
jgi:hypothetical protein